MTGEEFNTYDILVNDEDEAMLLLYAREGKPENASFEINPENRAAVLHRRPGDDVFLDGDYYIRDITSSYNIPQNYNGLTILSYLNKNNGRDYDQRLKEQYAIYNPNNQGQYQRIFKSIEELTHIRNRLIYI